MNVVAYCRVSTNKDEQLDSLEMQQKFFGEYSKRNGHQLVRIYADEGKSGTKMKNRTELLRLLADANRGLFDSVLIKDVSRLARNTVDFLTSIRKLKALGIKVVFVNYDQTSSDSSEFMLTMLSAIAQEESANTSKRVKFGKKMNAEKGRVPNVIYGYDKIQGEYFNLNINQDEAKTVRRIFDLYVNHEMGTNKIALELNRQGIKTKRGCCWNQIGISRILTNEIYIGNIINGKQEIEDFLTSKRRNIDETEWMTTRLLNLQIVDKLVFDKAQKILESRKDTFRITGERSSEKNLFSKLIRCKCCGASFRRQVRTYKNTYTKWICTGHNAQGAEACPNKTVIDEEELLSAIRRYFAGLLTEKPKVIESIIAECNRQYRDRNDKMCSEKELTAQLNRTRKAKEKYMEMYAAEILTAEELQAKAKELNASIGRMEEELCLVRNNLTKSGLLEGMLAQSFRDMDALLSSAPITNNLLSRVIEKIEVDDRHHIEIYLKPFVDVGVENTVQISCNCS